ncbi:MAG: hypothetical protein ACK5TC_00920 [bacterium]|jgi:hypothetical protein
MAYRLDPCWGDSIASLLRVDHERLRHARVGEATRVGIRQTIQGGIGTDIHLSPDGLGGSD